MDEKNQDLKLGVNEKSEENAKKVKKNRKKLPAWVIIPVIIGIVAIIGVVTLFLPKDAQASLESVEYITVDKGEISQEYMVSGTVESKGEVTYYAPANAAVESLTVEVGQVVQAGDLLVAFDTSELETQYTQAQLNEQSVANTNDDAYAQADKVAESSANTIANLESQLSDKRTELANLKNTSDDAEKEMAVLAEEIKILEKAKEDNLNEQSNQKAIKENAELELAKLLDTDSKYAQLLNTATKATTRISQLEIELRTIENELEGLGSGQLSDTSSLVYQLEQEISALENSINEARLAGASTTGITQAQANNMAISEELAHIEGLSVKERLDLAEKGIVAEYDGVVKEVIVPSGSIATQGAPILTIVSNNNVEVNLSIPTSDFDKVIEGNVAEIELGSRKYQGVVDSIDKIALVNEKGTPSIGAKVAITNPDEHIFIGVEAKVNLEVAKETDALKIPTSVINVSSEGDFVYVIEDGKAVKRLVELGIYDYEYSEVKKGLKEGDKVIYDAVEEMEGKTVVGVEREGDSL